MMAPSAPAVDSSFNPFSGWAGCLNDDPGRRMLFLLRHCKTQWNHAGLYQGRSDPPLSASGVQQARKLAKELVSVLALPITLLSSPLARARMTAAVLASSSNASVMVDDRLTELNYGLWEGHSQETIKLLWPDMLRQWKRAPGTVVFPGGESLYDVRCRLKSFLADTAERQGPMLAVTHDGVIRLALLEAQGLPLSAFRTIKIEHGKLAAFCRHRSGISLAIMSHGNLESAGERARS